MVELIVMLGGFALMGIGSAWHQPLLGGMGVAVAGFALVSTVVRHNNGDNT